MSDEQGQMPTPESQTQTGQQSEHEQPNTTAENGTGWTIDAALAEIKKLRAEAAGYRKEKTAAEKARAEAEAAALAEQGKYKELYEKSAPKLEEYDTLRERYDAILATVQETNAKRIEAIPDAMRTLVPEYDDPLKVSAWLDANIGVLQKAPAPGLNGRAGGTAGAAVTVTDEEVQRFATTMKVDPRYVDRSQLQKLRGK